MMNILRIIHNPKYANSSTFPTDTMMQKHIQKFYGLSPKLTSILFDEIAIQHFNRKIRVVVNLTSEFIHDIPCPLSLWDKNTYLSSIQKRINNHQIPFFDIYNSSQALFIEKDNSIYRYSYNNNGDIITTHIH